MKICFIAPANNYHTQKWCKWFSEHGHEVHVISFIDCRIKNVTVHFIDTGVDPKARDFQKLKYLIHAGQIKKIVNSIKPDVVNAHYATSYGAAVALSGIKKYILSVWGSDIYDFPQKSFLHKALLKYSLKQAGYIFSTSKAMAGEAHKYTNKQIEITPFGVDTALFNPNRRNRPKDDKNFVVGTVKSLSDKYGIRYILEAVAYIKNKTDIPIKLRISGKGPQEEEYHKLADDLGIDDITTWLGFISQKEAAVEWANMDAALIPSTLESESFGVSAVEAQASGTVAIISDIPGLMEATDPGVTSITVKRNDEKEIAAAIMDLYNDPQKRLVMGNNGVRYAAENFSLDSCFEKIESLFARYCVK